MKEVQLILKMHNLYPFFIDDISDFQIISIIYLNFNWFSVPNCNFLKIIVSVLLLEKFDIKFLLYYCFSIDCIDWNIPLYRFNQSNLSDCYIYLALDWMAWLFVSLRFKVRKCKAEYGNWSLCYDRR